MRPILLALATMAFLASGCGKDACERLGDRLCDCTPLGTTRASCVDAVKAEISRVNPSKDACNEALDTCYARNDPDTGAEIGFCDWLAGRCGKSSCGISDEKYSNLSGYNQDGTPITPDPQDPARALCPK